VLHRSFISPYRIFHFKEDKVHYAEKSHSAINMIKQMSSCKWPQNKVTTLIQEAILTLWHPGGFSDFRKKNSSFRLPYQHPSTSADCTRELFNGSNGSASLVDCTQKIFLLWGCGFFVSDVISGGLLGHFGPLCLDLGANR